jgi:hypothetical protein
VEFDVCSKSHVVHILQYDLAYGTKLARIKSEAENILMFETDVVEMPAGLPTVSSLDMGRLKMAEEAKFKGTTFPQH